MRLNNISNRPMNIWEMKKQISQKELNKIGKTKLTAKPTEDQLNSIAQSQKEESKYLQSNSLTVPIDWDYVKETINLSKEDKIIRAKQDRLHLDIDYYSKMSAVEEKYQNDLDNIRKNGEKEQEKIDAQNKIKANNIISNIAKGIPVSPIDIAFANEIFPEKVKQALSKAKELQNNSKNINSSYIDYKI